MPSPQSSSRESFVTFSCPSCRGTGFAHGDFCADCHGMPVRAWHDGTILSFGTLLDHASITIERLRSIVRKVVDGVLMLVGLGGVAALAFTFLEFLPRTKAILLFFWISLLSDLFLYTRFVWQSQGRATIRRKKASVPAPKDWMTAASFRGEEHVDVAATLTDDAQQIILRARRIAEQLGAASVAPIHLFASLLSSKTTGLVFARLGISSHQLTQKVKHYLSLEERGPVTTIAPSFFERVFFAYGEAARGRSQRLEPSSLLAAVAHDHGVVEELLLDLDAGGEKLDHVIAWIDIQSLLHRRWREFRGKARLKPKGDVNRAMTAIATPFLERVSHDLTSLARRGYLAPCLGRDKEIEEILRIMESGRQSVLLVGNPGTGKTSIVEGIAQRMVEEDVPEVLFDKRLVSLSIPALLSGAAQAGELEERLSRIMNEIVRAGNIALFIDNLQELIGVSTTGGEAFDLSQVLTSLLEKHAFLAIAATTPQDHRRYLEKSGAIGTVFQNVRVEEMDVPGTILVLEAKAGGIEYKNNVFFSYEAIERTATLTKSYIQERYLPDKAVKVLEEVAVYVRKKEGKDSIVRGEHVAEIISEKTKIPVTKVGASEKEKLLNLERELHKRIVGQEEAVRLVSDALRRARAGLRDQKRPMANFLFLGPTGVGKTELSKTVADVYFGSEQSMIRLDMSEYQEKSSLSRLLGTLDGQGGYLTDAVRKNPFSLVLLDELEKAHADILNVFLQVMDDGRMTDAQGRTVDFTNTIVIATSNAGSTFIQDEVKKGTALASLKEQLIQTQLRSFFRPEFLNRFDAIVVFRPLTLPEIVQIAKLLLKSVAKRLEEKGIEFSATDDAVEELARIGFDPLFGARPLRRAVQERVDNAVATALLEGSVGRRDRLVLEKGGGIRIEKAH